MKTLFFILTLLLPASQLRAAPLTDDDFTVVSTPASPRVAYAVSQGATGLDVAVEVEPLGGDANGIKVSVGAAAAKKVVLSETQARVSRENGQARFWFQVPATALVANAADWQKLRLAFAVAWPGGPPGEDRQRERFLHSDGHAPHDGLAPNEADWQTLDVGEHAAMIAERKIRLHIEFEQPMDGKATVVIEDEKGGRVRNLVSGQAMSKGHHRLDWDGVDENGNLVAPGNYRWRAASHPGIKPRYLFSFYNHGNPPYGRGATANWLADHSDPLAAAAFGDRVYLGAPTAESGNNIIQITTSGVKTGDANIPGTVGQGTLFLLADAENFYALTEGRPWYGAFRDLPGGRWQSLRPLSLMRWDASGKIKNYPGSQRGDIVLTENAVEGSGPQKSTPANNLRGAALLNGKAYLSLAQENRVLIVDAASGATRGDIKLPNPGLLAANVGGTLVAFSGAQLVQIDPNTSIVKLLFQPAVEAPTGMALGDDGEIFIADNGPDQNIKVFSRDGRLLRSIGKKGGRPLIGKWDSSGVYQPRGITLDNAGQLWVAERDTYPKRISAWDAKTGALRHEFFGPTFYGAPGGSFDPQDHTLWLGGGCLWRLDFEKKSATPLATLYHKLQPGQPEEAMNGFYFNFSHQNGRTFLIQFGKHEAVWELRADGSAKLWALCGPLTSISQFPRWTLPKTTVELPAVAARFAEAAKAIKPPPPPVTPTGKLGDRLEIAQAVMGKADISLLWVDKNGDDIQQPDEVEVMPPGDAIKSSAWGFTSPTLDLKVPALLDNKPAILTLSPGNFLPSGAPDYSLARARQSAVFIEPGAVGATAVADRFGDVIFNSSPMKAFDARGKLLWTFPNKWVDVHGSHDAPLPEPGVMQGAIFFLGTAPLDAKSEVFVINGNHGRFFVLTSDGFYLDEMFKDVRVTQQTDATMIGGETFGGFFGRSAKDGNYYLQSGHTDYRIFRLDGLKELARSQGTLGVSGPQIAAAQAALARRAVAEKAVPKTVAVTEVPATGALNADPGKWPAPWAVEWGDPRQPFPSARVKILRRGDRLHLAYWVRDPSPWRNNGVDWTQLFKTGDSVDFQFSTDPQAKPNRSGPVPGDRRLLVAPFQGKPVAVLYKHHEPGGKSPMTFSSPWRAEKVDAVLRLEAAQITVKPDAASYLVTIAVPLSDLGLPSAGQTASLKGDFGVIYGDDAGSINLLRSYWSNQATGLVNDVPGEIMLSPNLWGTLNF